MRFFRARRGTPRRYKAAASANAFSSVSFRLGRGNGELSVLQLYELEQRPLIAHAQFYAVEPLGIVSQLEFE